MALVVRIDVDRPYGREPLWRHVASRISSDVGFPVVQSFGYLRELEQMLGWLEERRVKAHVFFRRCTLPTRRILAAIDRGGHRVGLHLEDSRSFESFVGEVRDLERHTGRRVRSMSKHGSGDRKYGRRHHAPYEPEKYLRWAQQAGVELVLGNLEDPTLPGGRPVPGVTFFPAAFWLEPHWRDTSTYTIPWLIDQARRQDVVLLVHPENVIADPGLSRDFLHLIESCTYRIDA
jgi:hypothetical protein